VTCQQQAGPGLAAGPPPRIEFDPALPITAHRQAILEALERHPVIIVCGATGSGKSTQLPKLCLAAGRGQSGLIGHTQPRRIAARALARRVAQELGSEVGALVGFKVRFADRTGPQCRIKLMTDGILLQELAGDPQLRRYDTLIIDEAHERSVNIDLLLGLVRQLAPQRPELRVIVTSATLDPQRLSDYFGNAPVIEVSGRGFPVEVRYRPLAAADEEAELSLPEGIVGAVRELTAGANGRGDVLVFLPGEKQIREAAEELRRARLPDVDVLPLFARLSTSEQERIFAGHTRRRIVLATNVAETSLTVPGIRFVVDSGLARISRYSVRGKVQRLPIERIARASADQRLGRCGREAPGVCVRLYSQEDFEQREAFTPPEIARTNLASVILRMAVSGLGEPESFPFLDAPDRRLVNDGIRLLMELGAMDEQRLVTPLGRRIAALPCDPRLGRMLLAAARAGCLAEMLIIAAFLSAQDPRERPADAQQQADAAHVAAADARSDFVTVLRLWQGFQEQSTALSRNALRKWCREHYLSFVRMREWQDLHAQLGESTAELGLRRNAAAASYAAVHGAVLTGFLGGIGTRAEKREYLGARASRFVIAPGTPLATRAPRWVVAANLLETTRLYARMVAGVEPAWIEAAGSHLLKRTYSEPHWSAARGRVMAFESVSLYGLTLAAQRRIGYGAIAPAEAHEIFVREALVARDAALDAEFLDANQRLQAQIEQLEAKIRRRDLLADGQAQVDFYRARIPEHINSLTAFKRWWSDTERQHPQLLHMSPSDLMRRAPPPDTAEQYPDRLQVAGNALPLTYVFEPGAAADGLTLTVPEPLLEELDAEQLAWLVPGVRQEKIEALLRALPKSMRKLLVPVPDQARALLAQCVGAALPPFHEHVARFITQATGTTTTAAQVAALPLPEALRLNVRVVGQRDGGDTVVAESRDLRSIRRQLQPTHKRHPTANARTVLHRQWDFGDLASSTEVEQSGVRFRVYPALEDRGSGVALTAARSGAQAEAISRAGVTRLAVLALAQQSRDLRRRAAQDRELVLLAQGLALEQALPDALVDRAFQECFVPATTAVPRTLEQFTARLQAQRAALYEVNEALTKSTTAILRQWRTARAAIERVRSAARASTGALAAAANDVEAQLARLLPSDFLRSIPSPWFDQLPRYLQAAARRLDRLVQDPARDTQLARRVRPFADHWERLAAEPIPPSATSALQQLRWMIEEFRVSLFAQDLRTLMPVSEKRLTDQLEEARAQAAGTHGG
jgi:ATP-dependent helicase HrpA